MKGFAALSSLGFVLSGPVRVFCLAPSRGSPLPLFESETFIFNGLRNVIACKIVIRKELQLNSSFQMS